MHGADGLFVSDVKVRVLDAAVCICLIIFYINDKFMRYIAAAMFSSSM